MGTKKRTRKWTFEDAKKTIKQLAQQHGGYMPTQAWFNKNGYGGLNAWICKKFGGVTNFVQVIGGGIKMRRSKRRRCDISRKAAKIQRAMPRKTFNFAKDFTNPSALSGKKELTLEESYYSPPLEIKNYFGPPGILENSEHSSFIASPRASQTCQIVEKNGAV